MGGGGLAGSFARQSNRLLLRQAVQCAESPDQIARINRHNFACRKKVRERVESNTIVRIVEQRHQHDAIRDIKIGVAGRQLTALEYNRTGHRNLNNLKFLSVRSTGIFQPAQIGVQRHVIFGPLIPFDHGDYGIRSDETGDVIDVSMSVVTGDAAIEPDDRLRTKIIREHQLISRAIHRRVALLNRGEQAFLSGENRAAAIDIDRSTFEYDAVLLADGLYDVSPSRRRHALAIFPVKRVIGIFGPCIELKVQGEQAEI